MTGHGPLSPAEYEQIAAELPPSPRRIDRIILIAVLFGIGGNAFLRSLLREVRR